MSEYARQHDFSANQTAQVKLTGQQLDDEFDAVASAVNEEGRVTTDMIDDEAVTEPKLSDGAVSKRVVASGAIMSNDVDYYESEEFSINSGVTVSYAHGLVDEDGTARTPVMFFARQKHTVSSEDFWRIEENLEVRVTSTTIYVYNNGSSGYLNVKVACW